MDIREAFLRLKKKDKIILGIAATLVLTAVIMIFFFAANNMLKGNVDFPRSSGNNHPNVQQHNQYAYEDLPLFLMYPGTSYGIFVGGEEGVVLRDGTAFRFSEEAYIIAATVDAEEETKTFIKERFLSYLSGEETEETCRYIHKAASTGYLNREYLEYEGGILRAPDGTSYYVLTYRQPSLYEQDPLIAVVTTDKRRLSNAMVLLERMWGTFDTYERIAEGGEDDMAEEESGVVYLTTGEGKAEEEVLSDAAADRVERLRALGEEREDLMHQTTPGVAEYLEKSYELPEHWSNRLAMFYFEYENKGKTPESALVFSPSGEAYEATYVNADAGAIYFEVQNPEPGTWTIQISNNTAFGLYRMGVHNDANEALR